MNSLNVSFYSQERTLQTKINRILAQYKDGVCYRERPLLHIRTLSFAFFNSIKFPLFYAGLRTFNIGQGKKNINA